MPQLAERGGGQYAWAADGKAHGLAVAVVCDAIGNFKPTRYLLPLFDSVKKRTRGLQTFFNKQTQFSQKNRKHRENVKKKAY
jgi:hypothetical protein